MYTFNSMKYAAALLPALAIGVPMANASEKDCECPPEDERTASAMVPERQDHDAGNSELSGNDRPSNNFYDGQTASNQTEASKRNHPAYIDKTPERGYHSDKLVGAEVKNRNNNESIGEVTNLVLDESGQIVAAIVSVGGVMGIGERDVAISWDQIERKADGDDVTLTVDMTENSLKDAPKYSSDRNISRQ